MIFTSQSTLYRNGSFDMIFQNFLSKILNRYVSYFPAIDPNFNEANMRKDKNK